MKHKLIFSLFSELIIEHSELIIIFLKWYHFGMFNMKITCSLSYFLYNYPSIKQHKILVKIAKLAMSSGGEMPFLRECLHWYKSIINNLANNCIPFHWFWLQIASLLHRSFWVRWNTINPKVAVFIGITKGGKMGCHPIAYNSGCFGKSLICKPIKVELKTEVGLSYWITLLLFKR